VDIVNAYTLNPDQIVIYTTSSCGDCQMAKAWFQQKNVAYQEVNLEEDPIAEAFIKQFNSGFASVPLILFPDGSYLVEPSLQELSAKFSDS
jgi:glutaredoxin